MPAASVSDQLDFLANLEEGHGLGPQSEIGELTRHDGPSARQQAEAGAVADEREDPRNRQLQDVVKRSPRGSAFHMNHRIGCASATAQTDP